MSKLDDLLKQYCPNGVEYKKLGDVCKINGRIGFRGYTRQDQVSKGEGAISLSPSNIQNGEISFEDCTYINWHKYEESPEIQASVGDIIFGKTASVGKTALIKRLPEKATINPQLVLLKEIMCNPSFLSYVLKTKEFQNKVNRIKGLGTIPTISQKDFANLTIPVPPLPVQSEIVRILDNFTELTAELQAELQARKKQYEYYRELLLSGTKGAPIKRLGDTCSMKSGKAIKATQLSNEQDDEHEYPCFGGNGIRGYISETSHSGEFPIIGRQGALCGNVNYATGNFYATEHAVVVKSKGEYDQRYLFYLLTSMNLNQYKSQGAQPGLAVGNIENLTAPVPSLLKQKKIVTVLDRFDTLCNGISDGLPAEIEARQKQYEYYRDKLLTFKETL